MTTAVERLFGSMHRAMSHETIGQSITYRLFISDVLNVVSGAHVKTYYDVPILDASLNIVEVSEIVSGSLIQVGDLRFEFPASWLDGKLRYAASKGLSTSDVIVAGGTYRVIAWVDQGDIVKVTVRK